MGQDLIRYDVLAQDALRGVIRKILTEIAKTGLPGEHHFFITFLTTAPGVRLSSRLREKYPELMTVVIQHQYWDLQVTDTAFEVGLSFSDIPERLLIPFAAIRGFYDPAVNFELEFEVKEAESPPAAVEPRGSAPVLAAPAKTSPRLDAPKAAPAAKLPAPNKDKPQPAAEPAPQGETTAKAGEKKAEIVSLDAFRKKT